MRMLIRYRLTIGAPKKTTTVPGNIFSIEVEGVLDSRHERQVGRLERSEEGDQIRVQDVVANR
jgi:hypothetical protein